MDLSTLIDACTGATDAADRQRAVRDALGQHPQANLADLEAAVVADFSSLNQPSDTGWTPEQIHRMGVLTDVVEGIRAEHADRQATADTVADLASKMGTTSITQTPAAPEPPPAAPAVEPPAAPTPPVATDPAPVATVQVTEAPPAPVVQEPVMAATAPQVRTEFSLANMPKEVPNGTKPGTPFTIQASADLPGYNLGADLVDLEGLSKAVTARFTQLHRGGGDFAGSRAGIGSIVIERDERYVAETQHDYKVIDFACDEKRLPGGSLLAAGTPGWCAPAEVDYSFCPLAQADGLISLPTVTAKRGSLVYPQSPEFHTIYSGTGWAFTAADIDTMQTPGNTTVKPCYVIPCPDTTSLTLDPVGMCLQVSLLHERAYPEMVQYSVGQSLVAHQHQMNARIIAQMEAGSTAVDLTGNGNLGPGAVSAALEGIELQVEWLRYRHRLGMNTTMEMVAPAWMMGILRADLSKRMGVDLLSVTDQTLISYLALRGVHATFVLDWQDSFSDPATTGSPARPVTIPESTLFGGGSTPQTAWPTTAKVLIYPAGTWFLARMDIISLEGGLMDTTTLRKNQRLALFVEEAMKVGKRCFQSSAVKLPLCASGQTGAPGWTTCATAPKVAV